MTSSSPDGRRLARLGLLAAIVSRLLGRLIGLVLVVVLARVADDRTVALYGYLLGTATLVAILADLGVSTVAAREVAAGRLPARGALFAALLPQAASVTVAAAVTVGLALLAGPPRVPTAALLVTVAFVVLTGFVSLWAELLRATGRIVVEGCLQTAGALALAVVGVAVVYRGGDATDLLLVVALKEAALLAVGMVVLRPARDPAVRSRALLRHSLWLALAATSLVLLWRHGTVVVGAGTSVSALATYVVATRFLDAGVVMAQAASVGLTPGMSVLAADAAAFRRSARRYLGLALAIGVVTASAGVLLADQLTTVLFGARWATAVPSVAALALASLPILVVYVAWPLLLVRHQTRLLAGGSAAGAVIGAVVSIALVAWRPDALSGVIGTAVGAGVVAAVVLYGLRDVRHPSVVGLAPAPSSR